MEDTRPQIPDAYSLTVKNCKFLLVLREIERRLQLVRETHVDDAILHRLNIAKDPWDLSESLDNTFFAALPSSVRPGQDLTKFSPPNKWSSDPSFATHDMFHQIRRIPNGLGNNSWCPYSFERLDLEGVCRLVRGYECSDPGSNTIRDESISDPSTSSTSPYASSQEASYPSPTTGENLTLNSIDTSSSDGVSLSASTTSNHSASSSTSSTNNAAPHSIYHCIHECDPSGAWLSKGELSIFIKTLRGRMLLEKNVDYPLIPIMLLSIYQFKARLLIASIDSEKYLLNVKCTSLFDFSKKDLEMRGLFFRMLLAAPKDIGKVRADEPRIRFRRSGNCLVRDVQAKEQSSTENVPPGALNKPSAIKKEPAANNDEILGTTDNPTFPAEVRSGITNRPPATSKKQSNTFSK